LVREGFEPFAPDGTAAYARTVARHRGFFRKMRDAPARALEMPAAGI
jgi:hypothetical protein